MLRTTPLLAVAALAVAVLGVPAHAAGPSAPVPSHAAPVYLPTPPTPAAPPVVSLPPQVEDAGDLDPALRRAWEAAVAAGAAEGVPLTLTSGYRPAAEQQKLWDEALLQYGNPTEARRWVLTPWESAHVRGLSLDVGPTKASQAWLEARQDSFGLCRRYLNETWHFELRRPSWATCPPMLPSASEPMI